MENLDIVDEAGKIVGQAPRNVVHRDGLLHREVHVWLYTKNDEIIFQRRAKDKDTFPGFLDASIGGHVDQGEEWIDAAMKELEEEAGIKAQSDDLTLIKKYRSYTYDLLTKTKNDAFRRVYALPWNKDISDLRVEKGKATGFELIAIDKLRADYYEDIIPGLVEDECLEMIKKLGL